MLHLLQMGPSKMLTTFPLEIQSSWQLSLLEQPLPLNDPDIPTLLHRFCPGISFAPSSLAPSCSWEVLQNLGVDHLPVLSSVPLSLVSRPNECLPSFNFQKVRWNDFAFYFDSYCTSAEEYSSLSLCSAAALITSLALNAAKSSIPFGCIKCHPKAWWPAEVESAVSERRKAFAAAHRSDEDCQAYISTSRRASSVIAKAKAEVWQTTCSSLSPKSNPKSVHSLLPRLPSLLTSQLFFSQGIGFGLCRLPEITLFRFSAKGPA